MLEDVEPIEVVRGSGATLWGANAVNGVINIFSNKGRFHFEIKPETAHRKDLKLSSRLLKPAMIVSD